MEITEILAYFGALIAGLIMGLIGGGGSILTVPILVYLLAFNPIIATAYSLFVVGSSACVGAIQKHRKGDVDIKTGLAFSFPSVIAVYLSRLYLVPNLPDVIFNINNFSLTKEMSIMIFFAIVMLFASIAMIKRKKAEALNHKIQPYYKTFIQGILIGIITGLIGAGGGFLFVPALVLWTKLPMKKAVGTSLVIITINSLIGFVASIQTTTINWYFLLTFSALTMVGILIGGSVSKHVSNSNLKKSFGYFTIIMGLYIIYRELF